MEFNHYSVLLNETIENLNIKPDGIYVDGTLGGGGHAYQVASRLSEKGRLIGIDQDADAIAAAGERLKEFGDKITIIRSNYANMKEELHRIGVEKVDGIVLDLGVSSFQLDTPERGFTYRDENAPLDMRMDDRQSLTAKDIVNGYSEMDLYRIIRDYGEDKFAKNIAKHIVQERAKKPTLTVSCCEASLAAYTACGYIVNIHNKVISNAMHFFTPEIIIDLLLSVKYISLSISLPISWFNKIALPHQIHLLLFNDLRFGSPAVFYASNRLFQSPHCNRF